MSKIDEEVARDNKTINPALQIDQSGPAQKIPLSIDVNISKNIDLMGIASFNRVEPTVSQKKVLPEDVILQHNKFNSISSDYNLINKYDSI